MTYADSPPAFHKTPKVRVRSPIKVLVITDNTDAIKDTIAELRTLDMDVQLALFDGLKLASIPRQCPDAVLCFFTDYIEKSESIVKSLKTHFAPRDVPMIGAATRPTKVSTSHFDSMLFAPMHSSQIANRVHSMIRLGHMEAEITRRIDTLNEDFGYETHLPNALSHRPFQILFVGKATPAFMIVINALQEKNVKVIAAFTSFTAFDYLHEERFDAVVMNALDHAEPALSISQTMRRNSALYHIPTLFLVKPDSFREQDKAYESGASDIISIDAPAEEINGRVLELANYYRIHEQLKSEFNALGGPECLDEPTKLFNGAFLAAHLPRIQRAAELSSAEFSSIAIRVRPNGLDDIKPAFMAMAFSQLGLMLKNLIRMQDLVTRIDDDLFAIILPNTTEYAAQIIIERIRNVVDCAAFDTGVKHNAAFTMSIEAKNFTPHHYENVQDIKTHLLSELTDDTPHLKALA